MNTERHAILHLVAAGRITSVEAERLLLVGNERQETLWILGTCLAVACLAHIHLQTLVSAVIEIVHSLLPAHFASVRHALALTTGLPGGTL